MGKENDVNILTNSIKCLSVFENKTCLLYKDLADKVDLPLIKSLLLQISLDSQKHSTILKGLVQSMPKTDWKPNDLPKTVAEAWRSIDAFQIELTGTEKISEEELSNLSEQLITLESLMGEEYNVLVQFKNLELISKELGRLYNIDLESLKSVLMEIIHDEGHHKRLLTTIRELLDRKEEEKTDNAPMVRFQNPDAWSRPAQ